MKTTYTSLLIVFLFFSHFSFGQEDVEKHPLLTDKFVFSGGLFFPNEQLKISVNGQAPDDEIDLGEAFNLKSYNLTFDIGFDWRFAKKWKLSADFFRFSNVRTAELDEPIEWEEYIFDGRAELGVDIVVLRTMVSRILSRGEKHELGVGLGFHIMPINIYIEGDAKLIEPDGTETETGIEKQSLSVTAPLPDIGLYYNWAPTPKWFLKADIDWLYIGIGDYRGWLWDFTAGVKYQIIDFFGVGVNYKYYSVDLEVEKSGDIGEWDGSAGISWSGPMLLVHFNF